QTRRSEMVHEPGGSRETSGREREKRGGGIGLLRYRQGWPRPPGGAVLGLRRRSPRLGCVDHAEQRDEDFLGSWAVLVKHLQPVSECSSRIRSELFHTRSGSP